MAFIFHTNTSPSTIPRSPFEHHHHETPRRRTLLLSDPSRIHVVAAVARMPGRMIDATIEDKIVVDGERVYIVTTEYHPDVGMPIRPKDITECISKEKLSLWHS